LNVSFASPELFVAAAHQCQGVILHTNLGARRCAPLRWSVSRPRRVRIPNLEFDLATGDAESATVHGGSAVPQAAPRTSPVEGHSVRRRLDYSWSTTTLPRSAGSELPGAGGEVIVSRGER